MARSAGAYAEIVAKENAMVQLRLPSGEIRNVREQCTATIGQVSNPEHMNIVLRISGRKRWMGIRPTVRGVAMNPVDHPMAAVRQNQRAATTHVSVGAEIQGAQDAKQKKIVEEIYYQQTNEIRFNVRARCNVPQKIARKRKHNGSFN